MPIYKSRNPLGFAAALGGIRGAISGRAFGQATTVALATGPGTEIALGGYNETSSAGQRSIVSTSANDVSGSGTGLRGVLMTFWNNVGKITETHALLGTTPVNTTDVNVQWVEKIEPFAGITPRGSVAAGTISMMTGAAGAGTVICTIQPGYTRTQMAHHYVDSGKTCLVYGLDATSSIAGNVCITTAQLQTTTAEIQQTERYLVGPAGYKYEFDVPIVVTATTFPLVITLRCFPSSTASTNWAGGFDWVEF